MSTPSSSSSSKPPPPTSATDAEIDRLLSREASALQREIEVERILKAFKLKYAVQLPPPLSSASDPLDSPYDILDIDESSSAEAIKKRYKQLSLSASIAHNSRTLLIPMSQLSIPIRPRMRAHQRPSIC